MMGIADHTLSLALSHLMASQINYQATTSALRAQLGQMARHVTDADVERVCRLNPCILQTREGPSMWTYMPERVEGAVLSFMLLYRGMFMRVEDVARALGFQGLWINEQDVLQALMRNIQWVEGARWMPGDAIVWRHK
tara:strand:- start:106 stop:519 length:414 start_codon:yes stop_codon:yes gene_type:complete